MLKTLYLFIGPPGSGKSFKTKDIINDAIKNNININHTCICETYNYLNLCYVNDKNQYIINKNKLLLAQYACNVATENLMKMKIQIIIQSNSNITINDIIPYLFMARKYNYRINFVIPSNKLLYYETGIVYNEIDQINVIRIIKMSDYPNIYMSFKEIMNNIFNFKILLKMLTDYEIIDMHDPKEIINKMLESHILDCELV
jgi:predicted kinase